MNKISEYLNTQESHLPLRLFILMMLTAYLFSIAIRMIWVGQFSETESFFWNGQLMINTNDGYYYAEGARDILAGTKPNSLSPITSALSLLTAFFARVLPFSFETIILYMPAFLGSLLVVPVMLIARALRQDILGFIAALLAGITWSYYNRTMTGYYDTDMLTIVLPSFVLWSVILAIQQNRNRYLFIVTLSMIAYQWWYAQSYSLNIAMIGTVLAYTLIFDRKNIYNYKLMLFMLIPNIAMPVYVKLLFALGLFGVFHTLKEKINATVIGLLLGVAAFAFFATGGFAAIWHQVDGYLFRETVSGSSAKALHYFNVMQTVREAGQIPFETFANRISGHTVTFVISFIGYVLLMLRYPVMILGLPMLGLGYVAFFGGLRFTVYAVPVSALGTAFFIMLAAAYLENAVIGAKKILAKYLFLGIAVVLILLPNIAHVVAYKVPTVFNKSEVEALDKLNTIASNDDYVVAWWDYGYPLRYYSQVKTLIDGGQHQGDANFPVSFALTMPQQASAVISRLNVEHKEDRSADKLPFIPEMMKRYGHEDPNDFLAMLELNDIKLPQKTKEIFLYLPYRMMDIYPTISMFSNLDLTTGKTISNPFFFKAGMFRDNGQVIDLGNNVQIIKKNGMLRTGNNEVPINSFITVGYGDDGSFVKDVQNIHPTSRFYVIYMKNYNAFLLMDKEVYDSLYIQLFVLENYDKRLFEPAVMTPWAKVYRLKI